MKEDRIIFSGSDSSTRNRLRSMLYPTAVRAQRARPTEQKDGRERVRVRPRRRHAMHVACVEGQQHNTTQHALCCVFCFDSMVGSRLRRHTSPRALTRPPPCRSCGPQARRVGARAGRGPGGVGRGGGDARWKVELSGSASPRIMPLTACESRFREIQRPVPPASARRLLFKHSYRSDSVGYGSPRGLLKERKLAQSETQKKGVWAGRGLHLLVHHLDHNASCIQAAPPRAPRHLDVLARAHLQRRKRRRRRGSHEAEGGHTRTDTAGQPASHPSEGPSSQCEFIRRSRSHYSHMFQLSLSPRSFPPAPLPCRGQAELRRRLVRARPLVIQCGPAARGFSLRNLCRVVEVSARAEAQRTAASPLDEGARRVLSRVVGSAGKFASLLASLGMPHFSSCFVAATLALASPPEPFPTHPAPCPSYAIRSLPRRRCWRRGGLSVRGAVEAAVGAERRLGGQVGRRSRTGPSEVLAVELAQCCEDNGLGGHVQAWAGGTIRLLLCACTAAEGGSRISAGCAPTIIVQSSSNAAVSSNQIRSARSYELVGEPPPRGWRADVTTSCPRRRPMEKVSVAKSVFNRCSWKRISTTSFRIGSRPESAHMRMRMRMRAEPSNNDTPLGFGLCGSCFFFVCVRSSITALPRWVEQMTRTEESSPPRTVHGILPQRPHEHRHAPTRRRVGAAQRQGPGPSGAGATFGRTGRWGARWMPMPRLSSGSMCSMAGRRLSSSESESIALVKTCREARGQITGRGTRTDHGGSVRVRRAQGVPGATWRRCRAQLSRPLGPLRWWGIMCSSAPATQAC